ncbi:MAG: HlyD family secretion protein [Acidobacteria bacterium]|nr:HlyD family secretion protein [Acidobacteriota bacterium]
MTYNQTYNHKYLLIAAVSLLMGLAGCSQSPAGAETAGAPPPAKVAPPAQAGDTATVTLTPQAEQRLAISLGTVERKAVAREQRTRQLLQDRAGSARAHEEAQEELAVTKANLLAVQERLKRLQQAPMDADYSLAVTAPRDGILQKVYVVPGQVVPTAAALFEVISLNTLWVRVPVSVSDRPLLNRGASASIHGLTGQTETGSLRGTPVQAPPTADAATASVDLYYEVANFGGRLIPGEKVGVTLSLEMRRSHSWFLTPPYLLTIMLFHGPMCLPILVSTKDTELQ